jgi:hypothetical protein
MRGVFHLIVTDDSSLGLSPYVVCLFVTVLYIVTICSKHKVHINYRSIFQNHIFTNTKQKYMMLLPFERGMFAVSK